MAQQYIAKLYPAVTQNDAAQPTLGICLSGGGSRALTCALGQLSALNAMTMPDGQPILSASQYISSVSGGSWASILYTFLPLTINGATVSDADFLIQPVAPQSLTKGNPNDNTPGNVSYIGQYCMGTTPQQFSLSNIGVFLKTLLDSRFFDNPSQYSWFWIAGIGEIVLKPFQLYSATYNSLAPPFVLPSLMFSLSAAEVANNITSLNQSLGPSDFYLARDGRPSLVVNTNLLEYYQTASSPQIPVQATPVATSVLGKSPDGTVVGGGGVESFGFTSTLNPGAINGTASISTNRNYSLCDIGGCSSAFFAALLLQYIDDAIDDIVNELVDYLINTLHWSKLKADAVGFALKVAIEYFTNDAADVIPVYNYWPAGQVNKPSNKNFGFSDGGSFDNTGILGLLAQTNTNKIISFVNTETPLSGTATNLTLDGSIGLLFGYGGQGPGDLTHVQVFDDTNPLYPNGAFAAVQAGLYDASCGGGSTLGTATAAFLQKGLVTIANPVANIAAGRVVDVLWVYNNPVSNWQNAITDPGIQADLAQASEQNTPLWNFPNYFTGEQVYLGIEAVNMLAQLSAWNVQQLSETIAEWLSS